MTSSRPAGDRRPPPLCRYSRGEKFAPGAVLGRKGFQHSDTPRSYRLHPCPRIAISPTPVDPRARHRRGGLAMTLGADRFEIRQVIGPAIRARKNVMDLAWQHIDLALTATEVLVGFQHLGPETTPLHAITALRRRGAGPITPMAAGLRRSRGQAQAGAAGVAVAGRHEPGTARRAAGAFGANGLTA